MRLQDYFFHTHPYQILGLLASFSQILQMDGRLKDVKVLLSFVKTSQTVQKTEIQKEGKAPSLIKPLLLDTREYSLIHHTKSGFAATHELETGFVLATRH